jgi:hypothetical protein
LNHPANTLQHSRLTPSPLTLVAPQMAMAVNMALMALMKVGKSPVFSFFLRLSLYGYILCTYIHLSLFLPISLAPVESLQLTSLIDWSAHFPIHRFAQSHSPTHSLHTNFSLSIADRYILHRAVQSSFSWQGVPLLVRQNRHIDHRSARACGSDQLQ